MLVVHVFIILKLEASRVANLVLEVTATEIALVRRAGFHAAGYTNAFRLKGLLQREERMLRRHLTLDIVDDGNKILRNTIITPLLWR